MLELKTLKLTAKLTGSIVLFFKYTQTTKHCASICWKKKYPQDNLRLWPSMNASNHLKLWWRKKKKASHLHVTFLWHNLRTCYGVRKDPQKSPSLYTTPKLLGLRFNRIPFKKKCGTIFCFINFTPFFRGNLIEMIVWTTTI